MVKFNKKRVNKFKLIKSAGTLIFYLLTHTTLSGQIVEVVSGLSSPYGLAIDTANHLYIAESGAINGNKISYLDITATNPAVTMIFSNLNAPSRLKFYQNYLYVTESTANSGKISRAYLGGTTQPQMQSYFSTGLVTPIGIDVKYGNVYIGDYGNYAIKKINTSVTPLQATLLTNDLATDIVVDGDLIYYTNPIFGNVMANSIINASTVSLEIATGILHPSSLLLHNGTLYISDSMEGKIYRINPHQNSTLPELLMTGLNQPQSMVVHNNEIYIAEMGANRIIKFNLSVLSNEHVRPSLLVNIYPNPTQNILNIQTEEIMKELSVYDMLGKKVIVTQVSNNTLDVSNLAQGIYFIKIIGENDKTFSTKFIKK